MNMKVLIILLPGLLISSCTSLDILGAKNCVVHEPTMSCTGNPNAPKVTLNLNTMKANPPNVCARPGLTIEVKLVPEPATLGSVTVVPKNFVDTWLVGTNSVDKGEIEIKIPDEVPEGTDHDYGFVTSDGKCADPRAHVM